MRQHQTDPSTPEEASEQSLPTGPAWGSDVIAEALAATGVEHIALTPGSSFRGLHDSVVNYLDDGPEMLLCLHEEHAVAIAHGWAKVTGTPMAVGVHSNVGLMHASMAIYNAFCDRIPMILVGATGPVDATRRRPWIDWIHTAADQGALVRSYVKWDDQPASVDASVLALLQANRLTRSAPAAPVYVCLDVSVQEESVSTSNPVAEVASRLGALPDAVPAPADLRRAVELLDGPGQVVMMVGRGGRSARDWANRLALAERLDAAVVTDLKHPAAFPTDHPRHRGAPGVFLGAQAASALRGADVLLALDWTDLAGTLAASGAEGVPVVSASVDHHLHNGWSKDSFGPARVDLSLPCTGDAAVRELCDALSLSGAAEQVPAAGRGDAHEEVPRAEPAGDRITVPMLETALFDATRGTDPCLLRTPLSWDARFWPLRHPLDSLGFDGGAGLGSGPGMAVGAALALRGTDRLPVAVLGDGDALMGGTALWTASKHDIPLLVVVANNVSFYNDEVHQRSVATTRGRPVGNAKVGVALDAPAADLAGFARSLGFQASGPVADPTELPAALTEAVRAVRAGGRAFVDVHVEHGYAAATAAALDSD